MSLILFLLFRAKVEESYGRELVRLAKQFPVKDEIGLDILAKLLVILVLANCRPHVRTLKTSWETLKSGMSAGCSAVCNVVIIVNVTMDRD